MHCGGECQERRNADRQGGTLAGAEDGRLHRGVSQSEAHRDVGSGGVRQESPVAVGQLLAVQEFDVEHLRPRGYPPVCFGQDQRPLGQSTRCRDISEKCDHRISKPSWREPGRATMGLVRSDDTAIRPERAPHFGCDAPTVSGMDGPQRRQTKANGEAGP